jgi:hypothetical protein
MRARTSSNDGMCGDVVVRLVICVMSLFLLAACGPKSTLVQTKPANYVSPFDTLVEGKQTAPDTKILESAYALRKPGDIATLFAISEWFRRSTVRGGRRFFLKRDASLLFEDRNLSGCIDVATLFASFTRALKIPTVFVHGVDHEWAKRIRAYGVGLTPSYKGHTFLEVYADDSWYLVDPTAGWLYAGYDPTTETLPDGYVVQYKGSDMWGFGIRDRGDLGDAMRDFANTYSEENYKPPDYIRINLAREHELECYKALVLPMARDKKVDVPAACKNAHWELSTGGLSPVSPGHYRLIVSGGDDPEEELARFSIDANSRLPASLDGAKLSEITLPRELSAKRSLLVALSGQGAGEHILAAGNMSPGTTRLKHSDRRALGGDLSKADGHFQLLKTTASKGRELYGIWFGAVDRVERNLLSRCSLELPTLSEGWRYEAWLSGERDGIPFQVSLGRFNSPHGSDSDGGGLEDISAVKAPKCPGQWLEQIQVPDGKEEGGGLTALLVSVTVEPEPDFSPSPFFIRVLEADLVDDFPVGKSIEMKKCEGNMPAANAVLLW